MATGLPTLTCWRIEWGQQQKGIVQGFDFGVVLEWKPCRLMSLGQGTPQKGWVGPHLELLLTGRLSKVCLLQVLFQRILPSTRHENQKKLKATLISPKR
ncbi:hypothetical protein V6N13_139702 [Hibiscus sabdariffa]